MVLYWAIGGIHQGKTGLKPAPRAPVRHLEPEPLLPNPNSEPPLSYQADPKVRRHWQSKQSYTKSD